MSTDTLTDLMLRKLGVSARADVDADGLSKSSRVGIPLAAGFITALVGPSGCGKSRALRSMTTWSERPLRVVSSRDVPDIDAPPLAWLDAMGTTPETPRLVSAFGLADARLLRASIRRLSAGERHRLALLAAVNEVLRFAATPASGEAPTLVIDEFAAELDRLSARQRAREVRASSLPAPWDAGRRNAHPRGHNPRLAALGPLSSSRGEPRAARRTLGGNG